MIAVLGFLSISCSYVDKIVGDVDNANQLETQTSRNIENDLKSLAAKEVEGQNLEVSVSASTFDEIELKQAQLWTRIDELEAKIRQQKEKIKVLEQGLMLGVVPHELQKSLQEVEEKSEPKKMADDTMITKHEQKIATFNKEEYKTSLDEAKVLFRSGRFGKAYLAFARMEEAYQSQPTDGEATYWLARCWAKLREFQSSKKQFEKFMTEYPDSPLAVSAMFHLANTELSMGLSEIAVKRLQQIIKNHPYEGTAEAAKQVLANYRNSL